MYPSTTGRFLSAIGHVAPIFNHVHFIFTIRVDVNVADHQKLRAPTASDLPIVQLLFLLVPDPFILGPPLLRMIIFAECAQRLSPVTTKSDKNLHVL